MDALELIAAWHAVAHVATAVKELKEAIEQSFVARSDESQSTTFPDPDDEAPYWRFDDAGLPKIMAAAICLDRALEEHWVSPNPEAARTFPTTRPLLDVSCTLESVQTDVRRLIRSFAPPVDRCQHNWPAQAEVFTNHFNAVADLVEWLEKYPAVDQHLVRLATHKMNAVSPVAEPDTHPGQRGQHTGQPDSKPDNGKKSLPFIPESPDVAELCRRLRKDLPSGKSKAEIAREFTGEPAGADPHAQNLLRQTRRFPTLWKTPDK